MIKPFKSNSNRHIENLERQLNGRSGERLDCLVIAHSAPDMLQRIKDAFSNSSIAIITIPQPEWDMQAVEIDELLERAVNELRVNSVLLVGHSLGGTPLQSVQVFDTSDERLESLTPTNRVISLLDRIANAQKFRKANENHFLYELESLRSSPSICQDALRNSGLVQGVLYRSESGLFCIYNPSEKRFDPLLNEEHVI